MATSARGIIDSAISIAPLAPVVSSRRASDPPRTDFDPGLLSGVSTEEAPQVVEGGHGGRLCIYLGDRGGRLWYLLVLGGGEPSPLSAREREDILFLAGECAGLLFLRDFADEAEDR